MLDKAFGTGYTYLFSGAERRKNTYYGRSSPAGPLQGLEREPGQAGNRAALSGSGLVQASLVGLERPYFFRSEQPHMYEVMARRYRPAQFDEVVGQEHIAATLKNAITRDRVAHAYIFTGGHGCGKTTMARILAKALVCQNGPTPEPCGVCPICVDVAAGRDSDVLEIDGASNNGIEQIRQLREQAAYVPTRARFKIYIIDEVHMLSDGAFNALLKTLEEPPRHVKFILATTDPHKVPDTILSRCQRFDFRLVPQAKLSAFFRKLATEEHAAISDDALDAVAAFAEGSVRDGLVLLDQLLSFADGKVERADVEAVRGVASAENVAGIFSCIAGSDVKRALAIVDEVASRGTNVGDFLDQLVTFGRDLMALAAGGGQDGVSAYGPARETLLELAKNTSLETALLYLDVLTQARTRVRARALTNPLVALEMAVARLAGLGGVTPVAEVLARLGQIPAASPAPAPVAAPAPAAISAPAPQPETPLPAPPPPPVPARTEPLPQMAVSVPEARPAPPPPAARHEPEFDLPEFDAPEFEPDPAFEPKRPVRPEPAREQQPAPATPEPSPTEELTTETVEARWSKVLDELAEKYPADFRHLLRISLEGVEDGDVVLSGTPVAIEAWEDKLRLQRLGDTAAEVLGCPVTFRFTAKKSRRMTAPATSNTSQARNELARHPTVDKVRSLFDGIIVDCQVAENCTLPDTGDDEDDD